MQPRPGLLASALLCAALTIAGAAGAQTPPKKRPPPPRPAVELAAPAPKKPAPTAAPPPLRLSGLVGMSPVGDAGPACRAQCSKDRYVCHAAGDPADCDARWIPCLHACSAR